MTATASNAEKICRFRGENKVELPFGESAEQIAREAGTGGEGKLYVTPRILFEEAARQCRYELHAQGAQEAQPYEPLSASLAPQHIHTGVKHRQRALGGLQEFLAETGECCIAPRALKWKRFMLSPPFGLVLPQTIDKIYAFLEFIYLLKVRHGAILEAQTTGRAAERKENNDH